MKACLSFIVMSALGCSAGSTGYPSHNFSNFTNYDVAVTAYTPQYGIGVDDPKNELDLIKLDKTLSNIEQCMQQFVSEPLTEAEFSEGECFGGQDFSVHDPLIIKVAPDWTLEDQPNQFTGQLEQTFLCDVGPDRCVEKGLTPTAEHPCNKCRAIVQNQTTVVTVPRMTVMPANVITVMTGCLDPWHGRLATCASPNNVVR